MEPDVLFLSTHRLRKEVESLLQGRALGSALPVFTTAILGGPLPQSLLPYFQVFECCSQTTAVLPKAEPKQATSHGSSLTSHSWSGNPGLLLFTHPEFHTRPQATGALCPYTSASAFLLPPVSSSQLLCCLLAMCPLPILPGELLPHEIAMGPSSLHSGGTLPQKQL